MSRLTVFAIGICLLAGFGIAAAQPPVVIPATSRLVWEYDPGADYVAQFNIYLSRTAGIVPDGSPDAMVVWPELEWTITASAPGHWYAVVTAVSNDTPASESGPSNEVHFAVMGPPGNLQVVK